VHIKSLHRHCVRALLASRKAILAKCVDLENELRGLLRVFGIRLAPRVGHGSFDVKVRSTFADDELLSCALTPLLDARAALTFKCAVDDPARWTIPGYCAHVDVPR
jgi:transposase